MWQISGVNSDLRGARGANKLFWKLNIITMLMLLLINQAGNWPRIIRPRRLLIGHQVTTPASYWSVRAVADLRDSNDSWENEKLKFVANICVKGVKINYFDLSVLCCLISPRGTKQVQIASRHPLPVSLVWTLLRDWVQMSALRSGQHRSMSTHLAHPNCYHCHH